MLDKRVQQYIESLAKLPPRSRTGHKGTYGTVLGIGGSRGMAGAVALAGRAALAAGAGLVKLAVPDPILETVAGFYPELTTLPCASASDGYFSKSKNALEKLFSYTDSATAVFMGPGFGNHRKLLIIPTLLLKRIDCPVVVDADALNLLAACGKATTKFQIPANRNTAQNTILTPHPGEFARMRGKPTPGEEHQEERIDAAKNFARKYGVILVLKGHETIITDGESFSLNPTGNPGMATGGSGDVLTGVITGLLAQGLAPLDAAKLGVCLHGLAGDLAAKRLGEESVTATAILNSLPEAFQVVQ